MPIGRFRSDPSGMDADELSVHSAQIPEGSLVAGMGAGILLSLVSVPEVAAVTTIVGGVLGYLAGHRLKDWKLRRRRD